MAEKEAPFKRVYVEDDQNHYDLRPDQRNDQVGKHGRLGGPVREATEEVKVKVMEVRERVKKAGLL